MTSCDLELLEAWVLEELAPPQAAKVLAHCSSCPGCAAELSDLRRTHHALAGFHRRTPERIAHLYPAIAEKTRARRMVRRQIAAMALTFASLFVVIGISTPSLPRHSGPQTCARQCIEQQVCEAHGPDAVAELEERFAACLIATPVGLP